MPAYGTRIAEQAAYFGVTQDAVLRGGAAAKDCGKFPSRSLSCHHAPPGAPGASRAERFCAIVEARRLAADAALVQAGLARE